MEKLRLPLIYLQWLRQNTAHYQYRTKDAELLRKKIEACGWETEEDLDALNSCYLEFVNLFERNPICGTDAQGSDAAILAENFHYFFYENDSHQYIPMTFFLDYGGISNPEDAKKLYGRLRNSLAVWEKEALDRSFQAHEKAQYASRGVVTVYGKLLNQSRGGAAVWFWLLLMLCLLILTGRQVFMNISRPVYETLDDIQKISLRFGETMTALFSLRWILWAKREKQRKKTLCEWDYCVRYTGEHLGSSAGSFRDPEIFKQILQQEVLEAGSQNGKGSAADAKGLPQREPDYVGMLTKKSIKACNRVQPLDLLSMAFVFLCVLVAGPVKVIPSLEAPIADTQVKITKMLDDRGLRDEKQKVYAEDKMEDILTDVQFSFQTINENAVLLESPADGAVNASYGSAGATLYPLGSEWESGEGGALWYFAVGTDRFMGYIPAASCRLYDGMECPAAQAELKDSSGSPAEGADASAALDGLPLTGCMVRTGDQLDLRLKRGSRIRYLYLLTGDVSSEDAFKNSGKIKRLKLTFDETKEYYAELKKEELGSPLGCFIRIPDIAASHVVIQVLDTTQEDGTAWFSEVKICGQHMG